MAQRRQLVHEQTYRTILLWLGWASTAIAIYFFLYLDTDIWGYIKQDQSKITWVIIIMFAVGIAISLSLTLSITNEAMQAVKFGDIAKTESLHGVKPQNDRHAIQRFFLSLKDILEKNAQPDIESLIDVELADYHRKSHVVEVMGNLLITLGLIGTVIGLTLTLTGLTTSLDALGHDQSRLIDGLRRAMSGMGTAFYTTLLGSVLGGILLRVFALITDGGIDNLSDIVKKICMVYCASDIKPSFERDMRVLNTEIERFGANVKILRAALNDTKVAMHEFHDEAKKLNQLNDEDDREKTLRDSVVLQMYYSDLLKNEMRMINKINRSWWGKLRRALRN